MSKKLRFEDFYNEVYEKNSDIKRIYDVIIKKRKRKSIILKLLIVLISIIYIEIISDNMMDLYNSRNYFLMIYIIIPLLVIYLIVIILFNAFEGLSRNNINYNRLYKERIILDLINNFYDNVEYFPNKGITQEVYDEACYNERYDIYESEDYIEARINDNCLVDMAEVNTIYRETRIDAEGHSYVELKDVFSGFFLKFEYSKSINSELRICVDKYGGRKNKLDMDSSEFEKYFDVNVSDKIVGMRILTADVMEELVEFRKKCLCNFDFIIRNNVVYIRFHCDDIFEPIIKKQSYVDKDYLRRYYDILLFSYVLCNKVIKEINDFEV